MNPECKCDPCTCSPACTCVATGKGCDCEPECGCADRRDDAAPAIVASAQPCGCAI